MWLSPAFMKNIKYNKTIELNINKTSELKDGINKIKENTRIPFPYAQQK